MSTLLLPLAFVGAVLAALVGYAQARRPRAHAIATIRARDQMRALAPRLPFALVAAECIGRLLPQAYVAALLGEQSGVAGILLAAAGGALLPGGPMVAFPLAIALLRAGAGQAALVALVTAWSLLAINRTLLFELPLMGSRFTLTRLGVSLPLTVAAGLMAAGAVGALAL